MNHAKQPRLCPECEQALERQAHAAPSRDYGTKFCKHRAAFALVMAEDGWITDWAIQTCADEATAELKSRAIQAQRLANTMPDQSPPKKPH